MGFLFFSALLLLILRKPACLCHLGVQQIRTHPQVYVIILLIPAISSSYAKASHRWHPHQLRHNAATFLRKEFGLETARIILGHRSAAITEVYAEQDQQKAMEAMVKVG